MIRYCTRCVMPETKPDFFINEDGVCSACLNYENRTLTDWDQRKKELEAILEETSDENIEVVTPPNRVIIPDFG